MSDFITMRPSDFITVDTEKLPVISTTTRTVLSISASAKAKSIPTDKDANTKQISDQQDLENAFELAVWRMYEELEPHLRDVNRMLADS